MRRVVDIERWPVTIGRALDNEIVLDDPYVAGHHLRLQQRADGGVEVVALETRNGVRFGRLRIAGGEVRALPAGPQLLQAGSSRLRLRRLSDAVAPELAMREEASPVVTFWCVVALLGLWAASQAIAMDPGGKFVDWLGLALGAPVGFIVWCVFWGVASKLFQHRFEFWPHVAIAARGLLLAGVIGLLLPQVAASLDWAWLAVSTELLVPAVLAAMVATHAVEVLPVQPRTVVAAVATLAVLGIAVDIVRNQHRLDRSFDQLYMSTLPMPALRLARGVSPQEFVDGASALKDPLIEKVKEARSESEGGEDDAEE